MQVPKINLESIITAIIKIIGYSAILFVGLIFYFLLSEGLPAIFEVPLSEFLQTRWYPIEDYYGILPLLIGSLVVTIGALIIAVPLGLLTAIYIAEVASRQTKEIPKPLVELLGGLPSVVLGLLGFNTIQMVFSPICGREGSPDTEARQRTNAVVPALAAPERVRQVPVFSRAYAYDLIVKRRDVELNW